MRVGVLGSGNVGKTLAGAFASRGRSGQVDERPLEFHEAGPPSLFVGHDDSGGERLQRQVPDARVVKAFNIVNFGVGVSRGEFGHAFKLLTR